MLTIFEQINALILFYYVSLTLYWYVSIYMRSLKFHSYGLRQGEGFLTSSMRPAIFLRKRLCMFFSSMSLNLRVAPITGDILTDFCFLHWFARKIVRVAPL